MTGRYLDVKVSIFQIHRQEPKLCRICTRVCFKVNILNGLRMGARFRSLRSIIGLSPPSFWEWGISGCKSLTRCPLTGPFPRHLLQALCVYRPRERDIHCPARRSAPRHGMQVACGRTGAISLVLWSLEPNSTHLGWLSKADSWEARGSICINVISSPAGGELTFVDCGEGGVVQRSLQREKDSGDSGK